MHKASAVKGFRASCLQEYEICAILCILYNIGRCVPCATPERRSLRLTEMMYENWASDPEVTRFLRWEPHRNALQTAGLLAAWATLYPNPDYYQWAIVEKATGQVFGSISIFNAALGAQEKKWWNQGFTT